MTVILLAFLLLGCGGLVPVPPATPALPTATPTPAPLAPTPTPRVKEPNYTNAASGVSIWYPEGWAYEEYVEAVIFASSQEIISGSELTKGAALMVAGDELKDVTIEEVVQSMLAEIHFEKLQASDPKRRTIGGRDGVLITLEGTPEGAPFPMKGFLAGVEQQGWGHVFLAVSVRDEWSQYGPVLEAMLDSVQFAEAEPVYASEELGLSLRYPEGWIYEESGGEVIFGTSAEIISGADISAGAFMLVVGEQLQEGETVQELIETVLCEMSFENLETGDAQQCTIGGEKGVVVNLWGQPEEGSAPMKGFVAGVEHDERGYLFVALSGLEAWPEYGPELEAALDSVQFTLE
jgi:hypothetical protein